MESTPFVDEEEDTSDDVRDTLEPLDILEIPDTKEDPELNEFDSWKKKKFVSRSRGLSFQITIFIEYKLAD